MSRRSGATVELSAVHRFHDPDYAALTLRMRNPQSIDEAAAVAAQLSARGCIRRVDSNEAARDALVDAYFEHARRGYRVALVTPTNAEAAAISEAIQQHRIDQGELPTIEVAAGIGEQRLLVGDIVQTRRNNAAAGVENRASWIVAGISADALELASTRDSGDCRLVSRVYASEHVQLAYATTVHGAQGDTTDVAVVGPGLDAAGLYVGMTRGRVVNQVLVIAPTDRAAQRDVAATLIRGALEATIDDARRAATTEIRRAARSPQQASLLGGVLHSSERIDVGGSRT